LVAREQERFAAGRESVECRMRELSPDGLTAALRAAGFAVGWSRTVLIGRVEDLPQT
jgi:hypothetical protein